MSVWESIECLREYVFKTVHVEMLRAKRSWIDDFDRAPLALWWIPVGHRPTVAESVSRLRSVQEKGPTTFAFTLNQSFPQPVD